MNPILTFLKEKQKEREESDNDIMKQIENSSIRLNISLAKAVEKLNVLQKFKVADHLKEISEVVNNINDESGFKFKDDSVLIITDGRLNGLSNSESKLWLNGLYIKERINIIIDNDINNLIINNIDNEVKEKRLKLRP
jgi:hypothetical protein